MTVDGIRVIEAGYRLESDDRVWAEGVGSALEPLVDGDQGFSVSSYDATDLSQVQLVRLWSLRPTRPVQEARRVARQLPRSQARRAYPAVPFVGWVSQAFGKSADGRKVVELTASFGEILMMACPSSPRKGVLVTLFSPEIRPGKVALTTWLRIATHLSHAARLRATLGPRGAALDLGPDDAVLSSDGALVSATGAARAESARQALRDAARAVDRARGARGRQDAESALLTWKGLVEGRWSLVDQFDSDGRRFLVARRNEPAFRRPRALSPRERHVAALAAVGHPSKIIAYQLGISTEAANAALTRALRKLGLHSRAELASVAGVLDPWGSQPATSVEHEGP